MRDDCYRQSWSLFARAGGGFAAVSTGSAAAGASLGDRAGVSAEGGAAWDVCGEHFAFAGMNSTVAGAVSCINFVCAARGGMG